MNIRESIARLLSIALIQITVVFGVFQVSEKEASAREHLTERIRIEILSSPKKATRKVIVYRLVASTKTKLALTGQFLYRKINADRSLKTKLAIFSDKRSSVPIIQMRYFVPHLGDTLPPTHLL